MKNYRKRIADDILKRKLEGKGAVLIEGPKWCGKTTTAEQLAASKAARVLIPAEMGMDVDKSGQNGAVPARDHLRVRFRTERSFTRINDFFPFNQYGAIFDRRVRNGVDHPAF